MSTQNQDQVTQSQQPQTQVFERQLVMEFEYGSTASPKLHRRTAVVHFTTEPPIGELEFRRRMIRELEEVRRTLRGFLGPYFEEGEPFIETRLERMVKHAMMTIVRPHARRLVKVAWKALRSKEAPHIREVKFEVDYNGYDPPIKVGVCADDANGLGVEVEFASEKWQAKYVRPSYYSSGVLKPIDVLALDLAIQWLDTMMKFLRAFFLVGEERSLVVDGLVVNVVYGEGPLMKALQQAQQQQQEQSQEAQAQGQEQPQPQQQQPQQ